ncbi:pentatricopeptide repeat-containing protein At4g35850, mitochondrial isoform X2 [Gastrolobium bilobum]|uniref:pentatricopeptide repeat-containing protein At4g35850, mitochondrial isoform X2 n=1 Tax=Gastrolobium bilobum TaxID=150636 RepID=UPI002AB2C2D9|nr:pentatricopeptide repeat-containing protein At4g35850, mitochondrial isoform X2 [Gastrolobium bilobum]
MKFIQSLIGRGGSLGRVSGLRFFSASPEEYSKRNYANNVAEYNTVLSSIAAQRRNFLLRDVYDDMMLDGVKPTRDTFHSLVVGTMKGSRMQDAFYFMDQMKIMGLVPDVTLYNFLISTCGKCQNSDQAIQILEEMKHMEVKPNLQTYICLLHACAAHGRLDRVYAIVRDMTAAGLGLNKFCYAGLIVAHKNKRPVTDDFPTKVIDFVERSKSWYSVETDSANAENVMMGVSDEELYNLPTAEYVHRRGFVNRPFTAYHVAFNAAADLKNVELTDTLLEMLNKDGKTPDVYIMIQVIRCYCYAGGIDRGLQTFEDYINSGKAIAAELFVTLAEGAMVGYTEKGMQIAQDILVSMNQRNFFLNSKMGSELLLRAAGEKTGGYTNANYIWDLLQARRVVPSFAAVQAYYQGLKDREIPEDDPRLLLVSRTYDNLRLRFGNRVF